MDTVTTNFCERVIDLLFSCQLEFEKKEPRRIACRYWEHTNWSRLAREYEKNLKMVKLLLRQKIDGKWDCLLTTFGREEITNNDDFLNESDDSDDSDEGEDEEIDYNEEVEEFLVRVRRDYDEEGPPRHELQRRDSEPEDDDMDADNLMPNELGDLAEPEEDAFPIAELMVDMLGELEDIYEDEQHLDEIENVRRNVFIVATESACPFEELSKKTTFVHTIAVIPSTRKSKLKGWKTFTAKHMDEKIVPLVKKRIISKPFFAVREYVSEEASFRAAEWFDEVCTRKRYTVYQKWLYEDAYNFEKGIRRDFQGRLIDMRYYAKYLEQSHEVGHTWALVHYKKEKKQQKREEMKKANQVKAA
ncbi:hypothetical protein QR680_014574 [Steinernema hermaphroditum]|uniref:Uncharacterized protein n=1 Tax=Steinernema hermaphroditum TaxID=289476 RepID=A0AA39M4H2_9BILA|nr:hypothetical protein QR680_014574 [Steinernema hermaphroditum]